MTDLPQLIARAEKALRQAEPEDWTVDPDAYQLSPDNGMDNDTYWDVDGANGGWVAHVQNLPCAEFIAGSGRLIAELVSALKESHATNERLCTELEQLRDGCVGEPCRNPDHYEVRS
ncbi:hypothetical protein [Mycolicibacterium sp.]|uniref:hypothetical protein n=1 Tax=Mycolicibacterium sp. TaxID=2320850 RepID=UPI0037CBA969